MMMKVRVARMICCLFLFLMPCCVFLWSVMSWPHSGQLVDLFVGVLRFDRLYLHFLQCCAVEMHLPIRPSMSRGRAITRRAMVM